MDATTLIATCLQSCVPATVPDVVEKKKAFSLLQPDVKPGVWVGWHVHMPTCTFWRVGCRVRLHKQRHYKHILLEREEYQPRVWFCEAAAALLLWI